MIHPSHTTSTPPRTDRWKSIRSCMLIAFSAVVFTGLLITGLPSELSAQEDQEETAQEDQEETAQEDQEETAQEDQEETAQEDQENRGRHVGVCWTHEAGDTNRTNRVWAKGFGTQALSSGRAAREALSRKTDDPFTCLNSATFPMPEDAPIGYVTLIIGEGEIYGTEETISRMSVGFGESWEDSLAGALRNMYSMHRMWNWHESDGYTIKDRFSFQRPPITPPPGASQ